LDYHLILDDPNNTLKVIQKIAITDLGEQIRLNTYCEQHVSFFESRKSVKKAIKNGSVWLNGHEANGGVWLKEGDEIWIIDLEKTPPKSYELKVPVIYEDDYLAVVNKPAGIIVSGNQFKTLANTLIFNLHPSPISNALPWPLPVHRRDAQTSGLVIVAKTKTARIVLGDMFEQNKVKKTYHAIAMGRLNETTKLKGLFNSQVDSKDALTHFEILSETRSLKNEWLTFIRLKPQSGRTHQLRIHLATEGTPILGDLLYSASTVKHKGLFLTASELNFNHPINGKPLTVSVPIPRKFEKRLQSEESRWQRLKEK
jgi:RluA family pseudouridine synthase